jgi:hypothetical protein
MKRLITGLFLLTMGMALYGQRVDTVDINLLRQTEKGGRAANRTQNTNDLLLQSRLDSLITAVTTDTLNFGSNTSIYYDPDNLTNSSTTGVLDVVVQIGQELMRLVINNTSDTLKDGTPVYASGVDQTAQLVEIDSAKANSVLTSLSTLGLVTADIPPGSLGFVTFYGKARGFNVAETIGGVTYLAPAGGRTKTKPTHPNQIVLLGSPVKSGANGIIDITVNLFTRPLANKSYSFTTNGIVAGTYYVGGFYDAPAADANLTQALTSVTHGSANNAYAAHTFIVAGGAGTVDAGQVGLRVRGASITDAGVYTATDTAIITTDITTLVLDSMVENSEKFMGTVTFELYVVSGSPTTYSLDFNYGYAKYEDFGNVDFTVSKIEAVGLARLGDTGFDMSLLHHKPTGWTYSAAAFDPGNGVLADWSDTYTGNDDLVGGEQFAWKVTGLNEFINGDSDEGIIVRIVAGTNNSVQSMDVHIIGFVESF